MTDFSIPLLLAESDGTATIIVFVIIAAISLLQKGLEYLKNKKEKESSSSSGRDSEQESSHERQIREVIKSLERNRKPTQETVQRKEQYAEPRPAPAMLKQKQPRPAPYDMPSPQTVSQQAAADMAQVAVSVEAAQTVPVESTYSDGLSDAERAALESLKQGAAFTAIAPQMQVIRNVRPVTGTDGSALRQGLSNPASLQMAVLYHEILGKPVALRDS